MDKEEAYRILGKWAKKYDEISKGHEDKLNLSKFARAEYNNKEFRKNEKKLMDEILGNSQVLEPFNEHEMIIDYLRKCYGDKVSIALGGSEFVSSKRRSQNYTKTEKGIKFRDLDVVAFTPKGKIGKSTSKFPEMNGELFGFLMLMKKGLVEKKIQAKKKHDKKFKITIHNSQFFDLQVVAKDMPNYYYAEYSHWESIAKNLARLGLMPIYDHDFVKAWEHSEKAIAVIQVLDQGTRYDTPPLYSIEEIARNFVSPTVLKKHQADWSEPEELEPRYYRSYNNPEMKNAIMKTLIPVLKDLKEIGLVREKKVGNVRKYSTTEKMAEVKGNLNPHLRKIWKKRAPKPRRKRPV